MKKSIGLIGARGYVGRELIKLVERHGEIQLDFVSSRAWAGQPVRQMVEGWSGELHFESLSPQDVVERAPDVCVLALPNGVSTPFVETIKQADIHTKVLDLSADWRFDDTWQYGWPERFREQIKAARWVSNPGCYATGMQVALWPVASLVEHAHIFGVSGYSGAGTNPSSKNDEDLLRDNLMPYGLVNHTHEREVRRQMGVLLDFMPHVAPFFQGITLTVNMHFNQPITLDQWRQLVTQAYLDEPLIEVIEQAPHVTEIRGRYGAMIGGLTLDASGRRGVAVVVLDNLLKGAASQALQNINLMLGFDEWRGLQEG